jgi:hypothetical protein
MYYIQSIVTRVFYNTKVGAISPPLQVSVDEQNIYKTKRV